LAVGHPLKIGRLFFGFCRKVGQNYIDGAVFTITVGGDSFNIRLRQSYILRRLGQVSVCKIPANQGQMVSQVMAVNDGLFLGGAQSSQLLVCALQQQR